MTRTGVGRHCEIRHGMAGGAWPCTAWTGRARLGKAGKETTMKILIEEHRQAMHFADLLIPKEDRAMTLPYRMRKPRAEPPWVECPECGQGLYSKWVDFGSGLLNADGTDATSWHLATSCCGAPLEDIERELR